MCISTLLHLYFPSIYQFLTFPCRIRKAFPCAYEKLVTVSSIMFCCSKPCLGLNSVFYLSLNFLFNTKNLLRWIFWEYVILIKFFWNLILFLFYQTSKSWTLGHTDNVTRKVISFRYKVSRLVLLLTFCSFRLFRMRKSFIGRG